MKKQLKCPDEKNKYITELNWDMVYFLELNIKQFDGIMTHFVEKYEDWLKWCETDDPHLEKMPGDWEEKLGRFSKLIILKIWRPEKLMAAFANYVKEEMGQFYIEPPPATMEVIFPDTDVKTPFIYVLSTGADPTSVLQKFADNKDFTKKLFKISLGQGQGPKAEELINRAKKNGEWIMLMNCHLARSFMPELEVIVQKFAEEEQEIDPNFRLFLTSMPADYFPVSILQNGVKLTTEPPRGMRANMKRSYAELTEKQIEDCKKPESLKKLIFGLSFFHAVIQERRKFGPLGFNIRYEFNDSDLESSITMLKLFLEEQEEIPWEALTYVTGHINYGGRVTDDWDRVCILSILKQYYNEDILVDGYKFSNSGIYFAPPDGKLQSYRDYIDSFPLTDQPEIFGMHQNADITFQAQESEKIVTTILSIQPRISTAAGGKSPDEVIVDKANELLAQVPKVLIKSMGKKEMFKENKQGLIPSLSTVLLQEVARFNRLLETMDKTLIQIKDAIAGVIVMTSELDVMYLSFTNGVVPPNWAKVAYPSLKPLASWFKDLIERVKFMEEWLVKGQPNCFWLSGFFFPQGFMTGCLQTYSRAKTIPIDQLNFSFNILHEEEPHEIEEGPEEGVYIYGLYMDGARWDREEQGVLDQHLGQLYDRMPIIWFIPKPNYVPNPDEYSCPVYKTSVRAGVLSTTGQSTNFILPVELPTQENP